MLQYWRNIASEAFRFTAVSTGSGEAGYISIIEPSKLVEKAIRRLNATWNSVKQRAVAGVGASAVIACGFCTRTTRDSVYLDLMLDLMHAS